MNINNNIDLLYIIIKNEYHINFSMNYKRYNLLPKLFKSDCLTK